MNGWRWGFGLCWERSRTGGGRIRSDAAPRSSAVVLRELRVRLLEARIAENAEEFRGDHGESRNLLQKGNQPMEANFVLRRTFLLLLAFATASQLTAQTPAFDLVVTNGHIIDGTGSPWYSGDLGIRDGKIIAIGNLSNARRAHTIDARGKVVAPGFIDMLGQSEYTILVEPRLPSKIYQGITTEVTGEGESIAPLNDAIVRADREQFDHYRIQVDWRTFHEYFSRLEKQRIGINIASYVGATRVRRMVLGDDDVQPTPAQLEQMQELVRQTMRDGVVGVSTSLEYAPAPYAKTEELIALAAEASKFGGIYATHMRNEGTGILPAIDDALPYPQRHAHAFRSMG